VLIMTSNVGSQFLTELSEENDRGEIESRVMESLKAQFKPEFLNRVDDVLIYHQLGRSEIGTITRVQLQRVEALLADRRISMEVSPEAMEFLADRGYDPQYGARPLKRTIQRLIQDPLAMEILEGRYPEGSKVTVEMAEDGEGVKFSKS
jgi:ATP-dependent Clp protease ATP-binding subunit ClpB